MIWKVCDICALGLILSVIPAIEGLTTIRPLALWIAGLRVRFETETSQK
jgi:hypothetical protein